MSAAGTEPSAPVDPPTAPIAPVARRPALGWPELAVAAVAYVGLQLGLGAPLVAHYGAAPPAPFLVGIAAVSALGAVAIALAVRVRSLAAVGLVRPALRQVVLGVGAGLAVWVLSRLLIVAYVAVTGDTSDPQEALTLFSGPVAAALVVVIGGLLVPLGEELLFRGIGYGVLRRFGTVAGTLLSAAVFAWAHGLNVVFAAAFVLGVLNAVLYERTGSIWPAVAAHATFNLTSFGLLLALGG